MLLGIGNEGTHYTNWTFSKINLYQFINHYHSSDTGHSRVILRYEDMDDNSDSEDSDESNSDDEDNDDGMGMHGIIEQGEDIGIYLC